MGKNSGRTHSNKSTNTKKGMEPQVWVAIITGITAIILALFGFPPFVGLFQKELTPTVTPIPFITDTARIEPIVFTTDSLESITPTSTATITPTLTSITTTGLPIGMDVQLSTDTTGGRHPLTVHFDARGSFFRDSKSDIYPCGVCNYTWYVYQDSKLLNDPNRSDAGTFSFKFGKSGDYRVVVRVCRGSGESDCGYGAENISVN